MKKEENERKKEEKARLKAELKALREKLMSQQQEIRAKACRSSCWWRAGPPPARAI